MAGLLNITQERLIAAAVLFAAALVGAVAGAKPSLAIGMAIGAAFLVTAFAALPVAIAIYCFEPLGVAIDESSAVVSAAILLGISWLASLASADREEEELGWKLEPSDGGRNRTAGSTGASELELGGVPCHGHRNRPALPRALSPSRSS